jgi:hypothetical protein
VEPEPLKSRIRDHSTAMIVAFKIANELSVAPKLEKFIANATDLFAQAIANISLPTSIAKLDSQLAQLSNECFSSISKEITALAPEKLEQKRSEWSELANAMLEQKRSENVRSIADEFQSLINSAVRAVLLPHLMNATQLEAHVNHVRLKLVVPQRFSEYEQHSLYKSTISNHSVVVNLLGDTLAKSNAKLLALHLGNVTAEIIRQLDSMKNRPILPVCPSALNSYLAGVQRNATASFNESSSEFSTLAAFPSCFAQFNVSTLLLSR